MDRFDIVIVGGGIAGASLGAALAGRARVLILEAEEQCGMHSTGRSAAFWHEGYGGPGVVGLSRASRPILAAGGFLDPRGAIHIGHDGSDFDIVEGVATTPLERTGLEQRIPGIRPEWTHGLDEPGLADIDVAALHAAFLGRVRRGGGVRTDSPLASARRKGDGWTIILAGGGEIGAGVLVNAAGAWADEIARRCGITPLGIVPKRRTMVQLRVGREGLSRLPLIADGAGQFYFKGAGDRVLWLSPHDETDAEPGDAAPEEIDIAIAIDRFESAVDWPVERVERSWAGLRSFASDRLPLFGFDRDVASFFWCAGQGGFGIQTAPAAGLLCAGLVLGEAPDPAVATIDPAPFDPKRFG